jgi:hypothetical protein
MAAELLHLVECGERRFEPLKSVQGSDPTEISRRHVRRPISRSASASVVVIDRCPAGAGGKLAQRAMNGDSVHKSAKGTAIPKVRRCVR